MISNAQTEIRIVLYPGMQAACVHGLTDLFDIASNLIASQQRSPLHVTHWESADIHDANLSCVYDSDPRGSSGPQVVIIPPTMSDIPNPQVPPGVVSWLRDRYSAGAKLISICSGAFLLAETGLVAGRSVSTHRICAHALAKRYQDIVVETSERIIDHGDIMTAGGFMAWVDVGLFLVERILGSTSRTETARFMLSDSFVGNKAHYFHGFAPKQAHEDIAVLRAQEWVHLRDGRNISLASMATAARLERRTFLRRFTEATGMTPIEYCRAVRIARARELLAGGNIPQKRIAQSLGYKDVASFARIFRKFTGLPPGEYREKFGARPSLRRDVTPADSTTVHA